MISVIIPTYNRFEIIQETVERMLHLSTSVEFEIIVVNDGQPLPYKFKHPRVTYYQNPKKGVASARNYGVEKARYALLFFIDDDMWISKESLEAIATLQSQAFFETKCALLNWEYPPILQQQMQREKVGRYILKANYHTLEGRAKMIVDTSQTLVQISSIGSGSMAMSKSIFQKIGGYDESITFQGEDNAMSAALSNQQVSVFLYTPITCLHNQKDRLDLDGYLDRERRGYVSQFKNDKSSEKINWIKWFIFICLIPFAPIIKWLYSIIPNQPKYDTLNFRLIGLQTSIIYYKAWLIE